MDSGTIFSGHGPKGPLRHRCPRCSATGAKLHRCTGCLAVRYCSREHQVADRAQHKSVCSKIKKARAKLAKEDGLVRNTTEDFMVPANAFETSVGHFWGILSTRDYMRARFALVVPGLLEIGTLDAVQEAFEHLMDMMRLCNSDSMGLRSMVPTVMLQLDLDQECYDFVKWWIAAYYDPAHLEEEGPYDWDNLASPYLDVRGSDFLEDTAFLGSYPYLDYTVALLLLKLKLIVDIRNLKITRKILAERRIPVELREQIELDVIRSPLSVKLQKQPHGSLLKTETMLRHQVLQLGARLTEANKHFMFNLFDPEEALGEKPQSYSAGSWEEMALALQHSYQAFWEMEGVLELLHDARACAARDSEDEIDDMVEDDAAPARSGRTAAQMLSDVSVNRVWGYLAYAMENASYLGPWSERPSEQHTRENREAWVRALAEEAEFEAGLDEDGAVQVSSDED